MTTRLFVLFGFVALLLLGCKEDVVVPEDETATAKPLITVPWTEDGWSGVELRAPKNQNMPGRQFKAHLSGTSAIGGTCPYGRLMEVWGDGNASHLGKVSIAYAWCFNVISGARINAPVGDIMREGDKLHFMIMQENPSAKDPDVLYQMGVVSYGTGAFEGAHGEWHATMRVSRKDNGSFDWQMQIDGWLDCPAQGAGNP